MRCKQKILALLLAVALLLAMSSTALADGEVCEMNGTKYPSLAKAVEAVPADGTQTTITLLKGTTGDGVVVEKGKNIIFDLGGYAYTVNANTVGSSGTETNGFQLLKGSTVAFKNGTINAGEAKILIQNYADLTLKDVTLNAQDSLQCQYVCSNNCGTVNIIGSTSIKAKEGEAAFDVYYWPSNGYAEGVIVNVNTTGTIDGRIEYTNDGTATQEVVAEKAKLNIQNGKFTGTFTIYEEEVGKAGITVSGGSFTNPGASTITPYLAPGYKLVNGEVVSASSHDDGDDGSIGYPPTILSPTGNQVVAVMANGTVTLSVDAPGVGFGGCQWFVNRGDGLGFVPVAGATGPSLTLYPTFADNGSQYYCRVMNGYGYVNSGCFTLSVVGGMVPKTGDQVSVTLWVCLMALGVAGAAAVLARRRSR